MSGSIWMVSLRWALRLLGVVNIAILARLLTPEDFGLVAMATAIVALTRVFFELGVDYALIRKADATSEHFDAAWTIRLVQCLCLSLFLLIISPHAAEYYSEPSIVDMLRVLAVGAIFQGLSNIGIVSFRKELEFGKEFRFAVVTKAVSIGTTIALAFTLRTYWALIFGILTANVVECVFSYLFHSYRPKVNFRSAGEIWSFSKWMITLQIANYFSSKFDRVLLGGAVPAAQLGHYTIGIEISQMTTSELVAPVSRALVPGLAKLQHVPKRLRTAFLKTLGATAIVTLPTGVGVILVADQLIPLALGHQWAPAIEITKIASIYLIFATLGSATLNIALVTGHISKVAILSLFRAIIFIILFFPLFNAAGVYGVLYLRTVITAVYVALLITFAARIHGIPIPSIISQLWRPALSSCAMAAVVTGWQPFSSGGLALILTTKILLGAAVYMATSLVLWKFFGRSADVENDIIELLSSRVSAFRRKPPKAGAK